MHLPTSFTTALPWLVATYVGLFGYVTAAADGVLSSRAADAAQFAAASRMVDDAIVKMAVLNKARLDHPMRNQYKLKPGSNTGNQRRDTGDAPPPLLAITPDIAAAAALVAEADRAVDIAANASIIHRTADAGTDPYWMETISRKGTVPWGNDPSYKVFRNVVTDYGADPTGVKDSTAAIQKAIADGNRCGAKCGGSTTKNAIVYIPYGTYLVSSSISVYFGTQIIGDAKRLPQLVASPRFVGLGVLSTDVYVSNGGIGSDGLALEWYINTGRFYSQIRNVIIDIRRTNARANICALHYQVAQATSLHNVELIANSSTNQRGMFAENGSGGVMSKVTFTGGDVGLYGGNQQFTSTQVLFRDCNTAVQLLWDWGWVWKSVHVENVNVGFELLGDNSTGHVGAISIMDSIFANIKKSAIVMGPPVDKAGPGSTGLILDNVRLGGNIADNSTHQILKAGYYKQWTIGATYTNGTRKWTPGQMRDYDREPSLLGADRAGLDVPPYFERLRAQYEDKSASDFVHIKDLGAKGDGTTDDTVAVADALVKYGDGSKIVFIDSGTYILTSTVTIPKNAIVVGEAWAQFAARGKYFSNASDPQVMLQVGEQGDNGTVEIQDLILTTSGGTAGVVLMEWNVAAQETGSAALWDVHARVGGATGTGLTPTECPPQTSGVDDAKCQAASMLLHITSEASGYFDNMWLWVADHLIDDTDLNDPNNTMTQVSVYSARGMLIESRYATWLYGTASEHSVFYQYNFNRAQNIFTTMIQSETPYYQPVPVPPAPFGGDIVGLFVGDPYYGEADKCDTKNQLAGCDASWAVLLRGCQNIHIASAGTYSWFSKYSQDCIDTQQCQEALWLVDYNDNNVTLNNVVGIGAKNVLSANSKAIDAKSNLVVKLHPFWSHIAVFDVDDSGSDGGSDLDDGNDPEPAPVVCNATYTTLDAVNNDNNIPEECVPIYTLEALAAMLSAAIDDYNSILKTDYDTKFNDYADAMKTEWSNNLYDFYHDHTDEFFDCFQAVPTDVDHVYKNESIACPPNHIDGHAYNLYLVPKDTEKLGDFLTKTYGIDLNWTYGESIQIAPCIDNYCDEWGHMIGELALKPDFAVPNPKDSIGSALTNIKDMPDYLKGVANYIRVDFFDDQDPADALDASAIPVLMIQQAVQSMHDIYKAGEDIEKEKLKNLILTCITAILFVLPGLGEALSALTGIAMIARMAAMLTELGGTAAGAYDLATNKGSLALAIFSFLLGFVGLKGALRGAWSDAAALRRKMTQADIDGMGDIVKLGVATTSKLSGKVCKFT
ncbi:hypothetical protein SBRCBS47491_005203 [Sporothrix bragantina]|uniref:Rhamnogalacturonase A/B/Epimerase-like pectate lyase domain-containing protein n=1 Tax=Sporothrix bragantina TaxID=671064 RepID=A0ABP0BUS4_9PEZI